jgi:DNA-binding CsgD family transcriptional regulator
MYKDGISTEQIARIAKTSIGQVNEIIEKYQNNPPTLN